MLMRRRDPEWLRRGSRRGSTCPLLASNDDCRDVVGRTLAHRLPHDVLRHVCATACDCPASWPAFRAETAPCTPSLHKQQHVPVNERTLGDAVAAVPAGARRPSSARGASDAHRCRALRPRTVQRLGQPRVVSRQLRQAPPGPQVHAAVTDAACTKPRASLTKTATTVVPIPV